MAKRKTSSTTGGSRAGAEPFDAYHQWLGISAKDQPPDHYRLLGLELFESNADVIVHAADRQMGHLRTFQAGRHGKASQQLLNEIAAARRCLLDPRSKLAYDVELASRNVEVAAAMDGTALGEYLLIDLIARGGMGPVFKAKHRTMGRVVALKILSQTASEDSTSVGRFVRHVGLLARLEHPNLVTAYDAGMREGRHYLIMEYVEGENLEQLLERPEPLAIEDAVLYIKQAAGALAYVHNQGVVHRYVCPRNLLVSEQAQVKLTGFGGASFASEPSQFDEPVDPSFGSDEYLSPEQRSGRAVDHRSDIYSLGCTLYAALTNRPPTDNSSALPSLRQVLPEAPELLERVVQRMTATDPADRYATAYDVIIALQDALQSRPQPAHRQAPSPSDPLEGFLGELAKSEPPRWKRPR